MMGLQGGAGEFLPTSCRYTRSQELDLGISFTYPGEAYPLDVMHLDVMHPDGGSHMHMHMYMYPDEAHRHLYTAFSSWGYRSTHQKLHVRRCLEPRICFTIGSHGLIRGCRQVSSTQGEQLV